jgi:hypothetical protein
LVTTKTEQIDITLIASLVGFFMYKSNNERLSVCYNRYTTCPAGHGLPTIVVEEFLVTSFYSFTAF